MLVAPGLDADDRQARLAVIVLLVRAGAGASGAAVVVEHAPVIADEEALAVEEVAEEAGLFLREGVELLLGVGDELAQRIPPQHGDGDADPELVRVGRQAGGDELLLGQGRRCALGPVRRQPQVSRPGVEGARGGLGVAARLPGGHGALDEVLHHRVAEHRIRLEPRGELGGGQAIEGQAIEGEPVEGQAIEGEPVEGQAIRGQAVEVVQRLLSDGELLGLLGRGYRATGARGGEQDGRPQQGQMGASCRRALHTVGYVEPLELHDELLCRKWGRRMAPRSGCSWVSSRESRSSQELSAPPSGDGGIVASRTPRGGPESAGGRFGV